MRNINRLLSATLIIAALASCNTRPGTPRILVFTKTAGYHHSSIANGKAAIMKLGLENGFEVDTTADASWINEDSLKKYAAVVFLHTTGDILDNYQEADFERYIQSGGGYMGIHAAADCEYNWGWYGRLVGAYFDSHPAQQEATLNIVDADNNATKHLPNPWKRKDEWYNFKKISPDIHVLMTIDEKSYQGGKNGANHPMAWYHDYDGGRAFYTELGHTEESWTDDNYLKHILGGIKYAMNGNKNLDYSKATTLRVPDEDRFTKTVLIQGCFTEPTEMTVLPNLDILVAQRRGELMLYKDADHSIKQAGLLDVYWKASVPDVNAEEGFLGLKADPNFAKNHYIYAFYSPKDTSVNRLSRFTFDHDTLDLKSEHVILQFYSQRQICCHTGGSIAFGPGNMLFVSTGDNSTPFDEPHQVFANHGFAPLDDRPGHEQYDARRTAGNSNDLRGKIIRIKINEDGSYDIPEGNLFPKGMAKTRPEIYVMGDRNPYRISVDQKNGFLYWGEVGPDAPDDSLDTRGPRGYDEVNQAKTAGYFGWPLFVGNNYPYRQYDYAIGKTGPAFDPAHPVNNSRNNTGIIDLPPAQPAFIWYPYANSPDFPSVGSGGRNAMAGPVYYTDMYPEATRLPDYYNKKLIIYEWMRGWIKAVTLRPNGDFDKMEPFMPHTTLASCIDMETGPDGRIYELEYGTGWFTKNADAGLSRIDYNPGNRAPKVKNLQVNKTSGKLPFELKATVEAKDPEHDSLTYTWELGNGLTKVTKTPALDYTLDQPGFYYVSVTVSDDKKATAKTNTIEVYAGDEAPTVSIDITGNKTFYFPGKAVQYTVNVDDKNDSSNKKNLDSYIISADYHEVAGSELGHKTVSEAVIGKNLMLSLDCKTCHKVEEKSIGPAFVDVAKKYSGKADAVSYLVNKIIKGGGGVWGETAMAAHPNLKQDDAKTIVAWIQTLAAEKPKKLLPVKGALQPTLDKPIKDRGVLMLSAMYTDNPPAPIKAQSGAATISLRNSHITFDGITNMKGYSNVEAGPMHIMIAPKEEGWFTIDTIDLSGITKVKANIVWQQASKAGYTFELRLDAPNGPILASFSLPGGGRSATNKDNPPFREATLTAAFEPIKDGKFHNLYVVSKPKDAKEPGQVGIRWLEVE